MPKKEIADMCVEIHAETPDAILVSKEGDSHEVWLPLSQIEIERRERRCGVRLAYIQIPEWLAIQKELV